MRWVMLVALVACGTASEDENGVPETCDIPCQYSSANTGTGCQVNLYCDTDEPAVYCLEDGAGGWDCSCGPAVDNPPSFISDDICDLDLEAMACEAMAQCGNWTFN